MVDNLPDARNIFRIHMSGRRITRKTELLPCSPVDIIVGHTMSGTINCLDSFEEVHRYNISLESEVPHGHDNIGWCDITWASVSTAITGCTEPEVGIGQRFIFKPEDCSPHKFSYPVGAAGG